ncbi:hypothetical protein SAMN05216233_12049 [Desulfoluna spongiiphila]|uniref:Uncharacterized protein n=1 Tax=Desulfoluna spongiiphila TaxID=419481 RepID=A0A1G5IKI1_9BACT|nr:hypothetical protein SAMN05216233_12049 [Desulfoluna spongiiphila]VVS90919.1 hypothetical protein DBB_4870 [Desulfoluna spongiiphila]
MGEVPLRLVGIKKGQNKGRCVDEKYPEKEGEERPVRRKLGSLGSWIRAFFYQLMIFREV